jgi:hypothetical protein
MLFFSVFLGITSLSQKNVSAISYTPETYNSSNFKEESLRFGVNSFTNSDLSGATQSKKIIATLSDGLCTGTFPHTTGNVYFNYDYVSGRLNFSFILSPGSQTILGSKVRVAMIQAVANYYKINPPYVPHIELPNYDFHGSMYAYNRLGSKATALCATKRHSSNSGQANCESA